MNFVLAIIPVILISLGVLVPLSVHKINEGHVGVYWWGGALREKITEPGINFAWPLIETYESVQVTLQTDKVTNIPCGTSGGVLLWIEKVEVVNRLNRRFVYPTIKNYTISYDKIWIFDKIHHEINQFCSAHTLQEVYIDLFHTVDERLVQALQASCDQWAPGIQIIAIRITKPKIPPAILKNYELMEAEKTKLLISIEHQRVIEKEAETDRKKAVIESEKIAEVSKINMESKIMEKEGFQTISTIEDETHLHHQKVLADAAHHAVHREAEGNLKKFTPPFLQLEMVKSIVNNTKIFYGPSVHAMYHELFDKLITSGFNSPKSQ